MAVASPWIFYRALALSDTLSNFPVGFFGTLMNAISPTRCLHGGSVSATCPEHDESNQNSSSRFRSDNNRSSYLSCVGRSPCTERNLEPSIWCTTVRRGGTIPTGIALHEGGYVNSLSRVASTLITALFFCQAGGPRQEHSSSCETKVRRHSTAERERLYCITCIDRPRALPVPTLCHRFDNSRNAIIRRNRFLLRSVSSRTRSADDSLQTYGLEFIPLARVYLQGFWVGFSVLLVGTSIRRPAENNKEASHGCWRRHLPPVGLMLIENRLLSHLLLFVRVPASCRAPRSTRVAPGQCFCRDLYVLLLPTLVLIGSQARGMLNTYINKTCHGQVTTSPLRPSHNQTFLTCIPQTPLHNNLHSDGSLLLPRLCFLLPRCHHP